MFIEFIISFQKLGITTLEEKSLGCVQKGGSAPVVDVLGYGDTVTKAGLNMLDGPGNDIVAVTNLMACGAHMILFTTGRGTPVGGAVPTVKISTNTSLPVGITDENFSKELVIRISNETR